MSPLVDLLSQPRDPLAPVALRWDSSEDEDRVVAWREFVADVALLRDRLAVGPPGGWVLLTDDAYVFAVGLFALWHSDRHAISPPNHQFGALRDPQTRAAGVLTDRPDWFPDAATLHPLSRDAEGAASVDIERPKLDFAPLAPTAVAVEFFTSGTTGDEKPVLKEIQHLALEVEELGANWDERVRDSIFFSSASHQHLYGMLFGVLWPLTSGHVFQGTHFLHAGELVPRLSAVERSVLASVPTHLKRLALHSQSPKLQGHCREVFSSGGPLPEETAHRIAAILSDAPIEVFGSTETGGIAWRRQSPLEALNHDTDRPSPSWTPFRSVDVEEDSESGQLRVRSPFVSSGRLESGRDGVQAYSFTTGDRIHLHASGLFDLLGRADRVVKIGERRLDLTRMESNLRGSSWIEDVALTTLQPHAAELEGERSDSEQRVGAVFVPSEAGWSLVRESGRRGLTNALRRELSDAWDPVLHPRYWRLVTELPENAQGKTTRNLLQALFQDQDWGSNTEERPEMLSETRFDDAIERLALVPSDLMCFPGHFPDRALVPGVLQFDWALGLAEVWLGSRPDVLEVESLKFLMPLDPGTRVTIRVERSAADRLDLRLSSDDQIFTKGRVRIAKPTV